MFLSTNVVFVFYVIINEFSASRGQKIEGYKRKKLYQVLTPVEMVNYAWNGNVPERIYYSENYGERVLKSTATGGKRTDNEENDNNEESKDNNGNSGSSPGPSDSGNGSVPPSDDGEKKTDGKNEDGEADDGFHLGSLFGETDDGKKNDGEADEGFHLGSLFGENGDGKKNDDGDDGILKAISKEIDDVENSAIRYAIGFLPGGKEILAAMDASSKVGKTGSKITKAFGKLG